MLLDMLIGHSFVARRGEGEAIVDPATGRRIETVPEADANQVGAAVLAGERACPARSRTTPAERSAHGGRKSSGCGKDLSTPSLNDDTVARHVLVKL